MVETRAQNVDRSPGGVQGKESNKRTRAKSGSLSSTSVDPDELPKSSAKRHEADGAEEIDVEKSDEQEEEVKDDSDGQADRSQEQQEQVEPEIARVEAEDAPGVEEVPESQEEENGAEPNKYSSSYYLMKNEPKDYSIDDLEKEPDQTSCWDGVRNYRARNILQTMQPGQQCFFYHSACKTPAIVGIMEVTKAPYPDDTQFDSNSKYYDPKNDRENPRWYRVDVKLVRKFKQPITLEKLKGLRDEHEELKDLQLFSTSRLSVQNVTQQQWEYILSLEDQSDD